MIRYVANDDKLSADSFLQLVQAVWPGDYELEKTKQALKQTINITAYDGEKRAQKGNEGFFEKLGSSIRWRDM